MDNKFVKIQAIATYLGFSVSAIRKFIRCGSIPFYRLNGGIRFNLDEINKWTSKNKVNPI